LVECPTRNRVEVRGPDGRYVGATDAERKANLAIFKAWVGSWNVKRWNEINKEELNAIKAKY